MLTSFLLGNKKFIYLVLFFGLNTIGAEVKTKTFNLSQKPKSKCYQSSECETEGKKQCPGQKVSFSKCYGQYSGQITTICECQEKSVSGK